MARKQCKAHGCSNEVVGGAASRYCAEHSAAQRRNGIGPGRMSINMRDILIQLKAAGGEERLFVPLPETCAAKTRAALMKRDWVVENAGPNGDPLYQITGRGLAALNEPARHARRDGICSRCGERPRYVGESGRLQPYCRECQQQIGRDFRDSLYQAKWGARPCARCGIRPRFRYPNGKWSYKCRECTREARRENDRKRHETTLEEIRAGAPVPLCCKEGCSEPRYITRGRIQSYCEAHSKARWIGNKDKRLARLAGRRYRGVWRHGVSA